MHLSDGTLVVAVVACCNGSMEEEEKVFKRLWDFGESMVDTIGPMSHRDVQHVMTHATPDDHQYYEKAHYLKEISNEAIDTLIAHFKNGTSSMSVLFFQYLGNAANRVPLEGTAFRSPRSSLQSDSNFNLGR